MGARLILAVCGLALVVAGCAGGAGDEARLLQERSFIEAVRPLDRAAISESDTGATRPGSAERELLGLWTDLQRGRWHHAAARFERGLRTYVGPDLLARALSEEAAYFRIVKPAIRETRRSGPRALIIYDSPVTGRPTTWWTRWIRRGSAWKLRYWPFLDDALAVATRREVQQRLDPFAADPSPVAVRAGERAKFLQYEHLAQTRLRTGSTPRRSP